MCIEFFMEINIIYNMDAHCPYKNKRTKVTHTNINVSLLFICGQRTLRLLNLKN